MCAFNQRMATCMRKTKLNKWNNTWQHVWDLWGTFVKNTALVLTPCGSQLEKPTEAARGPFPRPGGGAPWATTAVQVVTR